MSDGDNGSDRTAVRTYIPEHQHGIWKDDADSMDMSLSEFVRSMVQAGRRGFDLSDGGDTNNPTGDGVWSREIVLEAIREEPYTSSEQLIDERREGMEAELDGLLNTLLKEGLIEYRGRRDGFVIADNE